MLIDVISGAFLGGLCGALIGWLINKTVDYMMHIEEGIDVDNVEFSDLGPGPDIHPCIYKRQRQVEALDTLYKKPDDKNVQGDGIWES